MLNDDLKKQIQNAYSTLLKNKDIKPRYGQRLMIADIARTLGGLPNEETKEQAGPNTSQQASPKICTIEAGTGTGKTIAYLVAALPIAKHYKKRLIISTATIALQEQILNKDLPDILNQSPLEFNFTLAKGRRRYLCMSLLNKYLAHLNGDDRQQGLELFSSDMSLSNKDDWQLYESFSKQLKAKKWNGEREDWPDEIEHSSWMAVTADHYQCTGRRCQDFDRCIFYKARERVFKSDIVVANHDLVLSDLAMGGGAILPAPSDSIYIFDEGHHLPDKAVQHFSHNTHLLGSAKWLEQLAASLQQLGDEPNLPIATKQHIEKLPELCEFAQNSLDTLYQLLKDNIEFSSRPNSDNLSSYRFIEGIFPPAYKEPIIDLKRQFDNIYKAVFAVYGFIEEVLDEKRFEISKDLAESWSQHLSPALIRLEAGIGLWQRYQREDPEGRAPMARWLNQRSDSKDGHSDKDIEICCSPILPSSELNFLLWQECFAAVITSATLAPNGNFSLFKLNSGVNGVFNCVPSPFDYQSMVEFNVPQMQSDPSRDADEHTDEVAECLEEIVDPKIATLVLFSSRRQMEEIEYQLLRKGKKWQDLILTQGNKNKQEIIRQHKKNIDKGKGSVIFGLASFAEGIDLPGDYCKHVIIAKLPFAVPDNPVDETLSEWLRAQGRNPFFELAVPQTTLKLIQACGRLIRTEKDSGKITLLDRRVISKSYGKNILAALPNYQMKIE